MSKLTARAITSLLQIKPSKHPDGNGLYLINPKSGDAYWMLRYTFAGKRREMTLGKYQYSALHNGLSLKEARVEVLKQKQLIDEGFDPLVARKYQKERELQTVDDLFDDWFENDIKRNIKHINIPLRVYRKDIAPVIGELKLEHVRPVNIRAIINRIVESGRPTIANDALLYCKQLFNHGIKLDVMAGNPASAFTVKDAGGVEKSKTRSLSEAELKVAFSVFREHSYSFSRSNYLACCLLLCLGVRKTELTESKWEEFDLEAAVWHLPAERSKTGVKISIPLVPLVIKILDELKVIAYDSDYVFPNRRSSKRPYMGADTLNRAITKCFGHEAGKKKQPPNLMGEMDHFTVHDLRRTCRTLLSKIGVEGHIAERCLNHKLRGVMGIYDKHDYFEERKLAFEKLSRFLEPIFNL